MRSFSTLLLSVLLVVASVATPTTATPTSTVEPVCCAYEFVAGPCSEACGGGLQILTPVCTCTDSTTPTSQTFTVDDSVCTTSLFIPKPADMIQACNTQPCSFGCPAVACTGVPPPNSPDVHANVFFTEVTPTPVPNTVLVNIDFPVPTGGGVSGDIRALFINFPFSPTPACSFLLPTASANSNPSNTIGQSVLLTGCKLDGAPVLDGTYDYAVAFNPPNNVQLGHVTIQLQCTPDANLGPSFDPEDMVGSQVGVRVQSLQGVTNSGQVPTTVGSLKLACPIGGQPFP